MKIIGFNFTKIYAEKNKEFKKANINAEIKFLDLETQKIQFLKDEEGAKVKFKHTVSYQDLESKKEILSQVLFEGNIALSLTKEESKELEKSWKKKELPANFNIILYNFILKKCAPKALELQDELNIPSHIAIPKLVPQKK